jgi:hypothetical protein
VAGKFGTLFQNTPWHVLFPIKRMHATKVRKGKGVFRFKFMGFRTGKWFGRGSSLNSCVYCWLIIN